MKNLVIIGGTGSGKTYKSIKIAKALGRFIYVAPCRQLVYESAIKYGKKNVDSVSTGEININNQKGNFFGVYESLNSIKLSNYHCLIVDEAHFINDYERGEALRAFIEKFKKIGVVLLVTATKTFETPSGFEVMELKSLYEYKKEFITVDEFFERAKQGIPSIIFRARKTDGHYSVSQAIITADTPPGLRLQTQIDFASGKITCIDCTNVLAQGLNFPAENILIEYNEHDTAELLHQKLGRLGRFGITEEGARLTCALEQRNNEFEDIEIKEEKWVSFSQVDRKREEKLEFLEQLLKDNSEEVFINLGSSFPKEIVYKKQKKPLEIYKEYLKTLKTFEIPDVKWCWSCSMDEEEKEQHKDEDYYGNEICTYERRCRNCSYNYKEAYGLKITNNNHQAIKRGLELNVFNLCDDNLKEAWQLINLYESSRKSLKKLLLKNMVA